jgi:non-specific serine/threonine protein kinase
VAGSSHNAPHRRNNSDIGPDSLEAFPLARVAERPASNLPLQLTSFVGREREIAEVERLLADHRLLTLTGPGGSGKTRVALAVAFEVVECFEDGVWFVELAPLSDPDLVPQAVASVLGVREVPGRPLTETLVEHLGTKGLLLILDNCEHLVEACAALTDTLLRSCPGVRILGTSREALGIGGENAWLVPSLILPDADQTAPAQVLASYEAISLFAERARAVASGFELTEVNAPAVTRVCRMLDGMPLAIELAAARVRVLSVEQISSRLEDSFGLLTGGSRTAMPRHRTLRAAMDWSHDLLSEEERVMLRRLSAFAGGFTLEATESVSEGEGIEEARVLELLGSLVDKSLVIFEEQDEETRYRLLETVRQYGRETLKESGEAGRVRSRHAAWYLDLAEEAEPELKGSRQLVWLECLEREHDNLRAAMRWLLEEGDSERVARLGWALWLFWWIRGFFSEGRRWMEEALAKGSAMPASARATALFVTGTMATGQADFRSAEPLLGESLGLFRGLGDKRGAAYALGSIGIAAIGQDQHERAIALHEEAADLFLEVGDKWAAATEFCFSAAGYFKRGDHVRAPQLAERGLALAREMRDRAGTSAALYILATVAHASEDHERARGLFEEGLKLTADVGDQANVAYCLEGLAAVAASESKVEWAARLWGATEALLEEVEATAYPHAPDPSVHEARVGAARSRMDAAAWEAAWSEGRAMTSEQAIEYALGSEEAAPASPRDTASLLSAREAEVLVLVAKGLTNPQVAERLYLSPRTVGQHLRSVYRKLGVPSRAAAAREAVERGMI